MKKSKIMFLLVVLVSQVVFVRCVLRKQIHGSYILKVGQTWRFHKDCDNPNDPLEDCKVLQVTNGSVFCYFPESSGVKMWMDESSFFNCCEPPQ